MQQAIFGNHMKSMGAMNQEKVNSLRQRLHVNGTPKIPQADGSAQMPGVPVFDADGDDKRKRHRRTATEIQRHYACPVAGCHKSYGSEGSMNQHMKLKHVEFYRQQIQMGNLQSGPGRVSARATLNRYKGLNGRMDN